MEPGSREIWTVLWVLPTTMNPASDNEKKLDLSYCLENEIRLMISLESFQI
jgi:hypothetical protein